ncbi:hypothetical protein ABZ639_19550 [Saccharomonospora sp. NPDC006951]
MNDHREEARLVKDRASASGTALLTLMLLGMFSLAAATDAVPSDDTAVAFAPAFYSLTVMGGLVASILGFRILEAVLRRRDDPARGWARTGLVILVAVPVVFAIACMLGLPAVALGIAANGIGVGIALLRSEPRTHASSRANRALLWVSLTFAIGAAASVAVTVRVDEPRLLLGGAEVPAGVGEHRGLVGGAGAHDCPAPAMPTWKSNGMARVE